MVIPALTSLLNDPIDKVRKSAVEALGSFGGAARSAIPAIQAVTRDKNPAVAEAARDALRRINLPQVTPAAPLIAPK
jgi:HEAT repeat protein